ncbi:Repressor of filamentous growth 1 [Tolypocladium paradoxum]|uniref:Repressor of filamentous growth 1 n=1 Tax=Tolypocladium paradoxum TaxID=94208 RepID=A0A2S4L6R9_9HYPO|nr:Repressor of filamentous growth 1 [Tolypocladium paradoxum]
MTQVLALAARQMETIGAPVHRHVDLGKQFKTSTGFIAAGGRHSPTPLRTTPSRQRASTIGAVDAGHGMLDSPDANAAGAQKQHGSRDMVCLCTPAPKIPRPRNADQPAAAFILYRQHHQAQVTADNPKLSNPDISKIIGEKWKNEAEEAKQYWKKLAEEEKARHQNQYPNYRYQPRRGNKPQGGWTEEQSRCPKCNGRALVTPQTPSTPFATSPASKTGVASQGRPSLQGLDTALSRRSSFEQSPTSTLTFPSKLPPVRDVDVDNSEPSSPEMKRRRANGAGGYHAIIGSLGAYGSTQLGGLSLTSTEGAPSNPLQSYARTPLPELGSLTRSQSGPMPPPLRPSVSTCWLDKDQQNLRHSGFDESLRLPPLQTSVPASPSRPPVMDTRHVSLPMAGLNVCPSRDTPAPRARTLEEMVMSISLKRKIAVLASICQPAPPVGRDGGPGGTRGAFIAVEGPDTKLLQEAGNAIEKGLAACGDVVLKVWRGESNGQNTTGGDSGEAVQLGRGDGTKFGDAFEPYIKEISWWQKKSKQIGRHITGKTALLTSVDENRAAGERSVTQAQVKEAGTPPEDDKGPASPAKIPVALAKEGFSLTISERYACTMPILDMYTPVDHWQWMATLWRGTVCPDLIVYVTPSEEEENSNRRTVELSRRMGLIVVKLPAGKGLDEGTERRLAFEVMEWMREGSFREGLPKDWRSDSL